MQDIELGKKIDELFQARWVWMGWGVNEWGSGDGCTDVLLLICFCCFVVMPCCFRIDSNVVANRVLKKDSESSFLALLRGAKGKVKKNGESEGRRQDMTRE